MQASIEIQGQGTTPFDLNNQNLVINAFAAAMTSVTRADFTVRYFTSDSSKVPSFNSTPSRRLLALVSYHSTCSSQPLCSSLVCCRLKQFLVT